MNFTQESIDELNAVLKVKLVPEDYEDRVEKVLKDSQKKASMPGFRPGKVPAGMIKKMYGKSILVDEINKVLYDSLTKYITDNKLDLLGNPLPKKEEDLNIDWDNQKEFEFSYELGFAPTFDITLSDKDTFEVMHVKIDDKLVSTNANDIARRYGKMINPEVSIDNDLLFGEFIEVDSKGAVIDGGIAKSTTLSLDRINDADTKKLFIGIKKGDTLVVDIQKVSQNLTDLAAMLGVTKEVAGNIKNNFTFTLNNISRMEPAALDEQLFSKVYGPEVKDLETFHSKIREELKAMFDKESERKLKNDIVIHLLDKLKLKLPSDFLKRWMMSVSEKPITLEEITLEFDNYAKGLQWQLIENKLIKEYNIKVDHEEIIAQIKALITEQYSKFNPTPMDEKELNETVMRVLKNEKETEKLYQKMYDDKLMELYKKSFTFKEKEVSEDEFYASFKS